MKTAHWTTIIIIFTFLLYPNNTLCAAVIHESATMGPTGQTGGYGIDSYTFIGSRFYIAQQVQVTAIGGHMLAGWPEDDIFGAIVKLNGATDLPKGFPFSGTEVVAHVQFTPNYPSTDFRAPLSITLTPGYYALVFGSGLYGATGTALMPNGGQTDLPGASYIYWDGYYDFEWFNAVPFQGRFVVEGTIVIVPSYCAATGVCDEYISRVQVGSINNATACSSNGYADYTLLSTTMQIGAGYPITITNGNPVYPDDRCGIWVDWNQDLDFTDVGEQITVNGNPGVGPYTATITPPATAALGNTRMRVRIVYAETPVPCNPLVNGYGETEDYTITVTNPAPTTVNISGCVKTAEGVRIKGIRITSTAGPNTTTDALGKYSLTLPSPFTGVITPFQYDWTFIPQERTYFNQSTNIADQNFIGTYSIGYGGGSGTASSPYLIYNNVQLNAIGARAYDWNKHFRLMADINLKEFNGLSGKPSFNRIGCYLNYGVAIMPFTGNFDGGGHTISNFTFDSNAGIDGVGLFGFVDNASTHIKNVKLTNVDVNSTTDTVGTAALVGDLYNGTVSGCSVQGGSVHSWNSVAGGLIGKSLDGGTISDCNADVNVSGDTQVGGIVGSTYGLISDCRSSCNVTGKMECGGLIGTISAPSGQAIRCRSSGNVTINYSTIIDRTAGGLVGSNSGTIEQCYSTANVTGSLGDEIGGLVGRNGGGKIFNSYASGAVSGEYYIGGLVGICWDTNVINCCSAGPVTATTPYKGGLIGWQTSGSSNNIIGSFWDKLTSGMTTSYGGTGKTTAEMKTLSTFTGAGWDFKGESANGEDEIWYMEAGDYPRLLWQMGFKYGGGAGEPGDPYLIFTPAQMNTIGTDLNDLNKHFRLTADIDLSIYSGLFEYHIIGTDVNAFTGVFNGNGHTISNFTYPTSGVVHNIGIFGCVSGPNAVIKNVGLLNPNINAPLGDNVGALVGAIKNQAAVNNCFVEGGTVTGGIYVGGLIGSDSNKPSITDCYSTTWVYGESNVGGLIGAKGSGTVSCCYTNGRATGTEDSTGGLIGWSSSGAYILNCYSTTYTQGFDGTGGLLGMSSNCSIVYCYAAGYVNGNLFYSGGLIGRLPTAPTPTNTIINSFWDTQISNQSQSFGGIGLTTAQMKDVNTFINANWDFIDQNDGPTDIWAMPSAGGYPILWWQLDPSPDLPSFSGGQGTAAEPYLISTPEDLAGIGYNPRLMPAYFMLTEDLDMSSIDFYPIGNRWYPFLGSFYGQQHKIYNLHIDCNGIDTVGLIGRAYGTAMTIQDIGLIDADVNAGTGNYVGTLAGYTGNGVAVSNCFTEGCIVRGNGYLGGLIGINLGKLDRCYAEGAADGNINIGLLAGVNSGDINECYTEGICSGNNSVGHLVGYNAGNGEISGCRAIGISTATADIAGGLVGNNFGASVSDCYAQGDVSANRGAGGLVGNDFSGAISRCYSTCSVEGNQYVGGLIGAGSSDTTVTGSFWDVNASGEPNSAGGIGKTTAEMKMLSTFIDAGWDFVGETANGPNDIWKIDEGQDYPRLAWEPAKDITFQVDLSSLWMYQNLPNNTNSYIMAGITDFDDPQGNENYTYSLEIVLPSDVNVAPTKIEEGDDYYLWKLVAPGCNLPGGISNSGQTFKARVKVVGNDFGNYGVAEKEFAIALLGDVDNNGKVDGDDRSMVNLFWKTGSAGPYTLKDCDMDRNGKVDSDDRSMVNLIWKKAIPGIRNSVASPCPLR